MGEQNDEEMRRELARLRELLDDLEGRIPDKEGSDVPKQKDELEALLAFQEESSESLLDKTNVLATGVGYKVTGGQETDALSLKVYVDGKIPSDREEEVPEADLVSQRDFDQPIDVEDMDPPFAFESSQIGPSESFDSDPPEAGMSWSMEESELEVSPLTLRARVRPAMGGYSVSHYRGTAGTIATCVRDRFFGSTGRNFYILSNNHVLANSNDARIGDPILQPGPYDGGRLPRDIIGRLSKYVPIRFRRRRGGRWYYPPNYVDAAIARVDFSNCSREIYWIGYLNAWRRRASVRPRMLVQKTGRTTDYTVGIIDAVNAKVNVNYGSGRIARFVNQVIIKPGGFSAPGDSGSLILDRDENALGLLFAGSRTHTIANHIERVRALLRVELSEKVV